MKKVNGVWTEEPPEKPEHWIHVPISEIVGPLFGWVFLIGGAVLALVWTPIERQT